MLLRQLLAQYFLILTYPSIRFLDNERSFFFFFFLLLLLFEKRTMKGIGTSICKYISINEKLYFAPHNLESLSI